jgi:hypothetical protein
MEFIYQLIKGLDPIKVFILIFLIVALIFCVKFFIIAVRAGKRRLQKKIRKTQLLMEKEQYEKALHVISSVLSDNGYNYRMPKQKKSILQSTVTYEDLEPAMLLLTEILPKNNRGGVCYKVFEDMLRFVDQLEDVKVGKGNKAAFNKTIYERLSKHMFDEKDFRGAIANSAVTMIEELKALKLLGKVDELKEKETMKLSDMMQEALTQLGIEASAKGLEDRLNACKASKIEETEIRNVHFDIFDFVKTAEMAKTRKKRSPVHSIMSNVKASERRKKEEDEVKVKDEQDKAVKKIQEREKKEDKGVIHL